MIDLVSHGNKYPEIARLNRFLRIPLISAAMLKAMFGGNICKINDEFKKYHFEENRNKWQLFKLKMKMVYYRFAYEFIYCEFVSLDFDKHTKKENLKNVAAYEYLRVMREIISHEDPEIIEVFCDKRKTYKKYKDFFKRDVVIIENENDIDELKKFAAKHRNFILKPALRNNGTGIKIYDLDTDNVNLEDIFNNAIKQGGAIIEELIHQTGLINEFNPSSVNTVRFVTFFHNGQLTKVSAGLRMGRTGAELDNASLGGVFVGVDTETGIIHSQGQAMYSTKRYDEHPDSHIKFVGTQIPHWDELLETVEEIVRVFPEKKYIGWDFAYSDKGWVICEANGVPGHQLCQTVAKEGLRPLYSKTLFTLVKDCDKYSKAIY